MSGGHCGGKEEIQHVKRKLFYMTESEEGQFAVPLCDIPKDKNTKRITRRSTTKVRQIEMNSDIENTFEEQVGRSHNSTYCR